MKWLIYLSAAIIILDGIFNLDIFLTGSDRLSLVYRSAFLIKVLLVMFSIYFFSKIPKKIGLLCLILFLAAKFLLGIYFGGAVKSFLGHVYFYSFIILGYIAGWQLARSNLTKIKFNNNFFKIVTWLTLVICIIYFTAYQFGSISYFGMGIQIPILVAVYLASRSSKLYGLILFLIVVLTGKRSNFLVYLSQLFGPRIFSGRFSLVGMITGLLTCSLILYFSYQIGLMARFQGLVDLIFEFDQDDIDKTRNLFYLATGGRSEEVFAYFIDQSHSLSVLLLGQAAGHSFVITDLAGNDYQHYYFHISPLNLIYHFGIPAGILMIFHQFSILIWALRYVSRERNIFCFLYVGYYLMSLFGAVVIIDVCFWVLYFYCHSLRQFNSKGRRAESLKYDGDISLNER